MKEYMGDPPLRLDAAVASLRDPSSQGTLQKVLQ